ncbi:MAG: hypothetical protein ACE5IY_07005 [bacterium]
MRKVTGYFVSLFVLGSVVLISRVYPQGVLCEIDHISPQEIKVEGFRLESEQDVEIEAVGFRRGRRHRFALTRAWILDARTRALVWEMEDADTHEKSRRLVEYEDVLTLPEGEYEVYYSSYTYHFDGEGFGRFFRQWFDEFFDGEEEDETDLHLQKDWDQFKIVVRGNGRRYRGEEIEQLRRVFLQNAFISMVKMRDEENVRQGFKLERPTRVQIYALGEARRDGTFDYGWILDARSRKKVWKFEYRSSQYAGGARKNRMVNETMALPKGEYVAIYVTDDSHSADRWNAAPPNDPYFWGLTLRVENPSDKKYVKNFDYEEVEQGHVIVKFTRLRDNEFHSQPFKCNRDVALRIYALGEGRRTEMFDYAWIIDATTHKKVWQMDYANTEHAGGGEKNRLHDGIVRLQKGNYVVYCVTDGSHSYWDWNTAPPYDQESWGITILADDSKFKPGDVTKLDERENGKIIVQIVGLHDYDRERERFTLDRDTEVRVYALGEGSSGNMYDYGWIEDAETRQTVWEMTFRQTEHAGGARKNRVFDGTIFLKRGEYVLYYETDDSHSFEEWNDAPPYDPANWGITLYRLHD